MLPLSHIQTSFVDWPGHITLLAVVRGCNLRCPYCYNQELLKMCSTIEMDALDAFSKLELERIINTTKLDRVLFTGGEPLSYHGSHIVETIYHCRNINPNMKIGLHTNGMNPSLLDLLIHDKFLDFVALDIKTIPDKYFLVNQGKSTIDDSPCSVLIDESISILKSADIEKEFRITPFHDCVDKNDLIEICRMFEGYPFFINSPYDDHNKNLHPYSSNEIEDIHRQFPYVIVRTERLKTNYG